MQVNTTCEQKQKTKQKAFVEEEGTINFNSNISANNPAIENIFKQLEDIQDLRTYQNALKEYILSVQSPMFNPDQLDSFSNEQRLRDSFGNKLNRRVHDL